MAEAVTGLELRSKVTGVGKLELRLEPVTLDPPGDGEVIVRVEAAPINPSDLGLLLGPADPAPAVAGGTAERPPLTLAIPADPMALRGCRSATRGRAPSSGRGRAPSTWPAASSARSAGRCTRSTASCARPTWCR